MTTIGTVIIGGATYDVEADCSQSRKHGTPTSGIVNVSEDVAAKLKWQGAWKQISDADGNIFEVPSVHCSQMDLWIGEEQ